MLKNLLLNILFPQFCLICSKEGFLVCPDCLHNIEINQSFYCPFCSLPYRLSNPEKCKSHQGMFLDGHLYPASFDERTVKKLITSFKYKPYHKSLATSLAYLIISHILLTENQSIFKTGENSILVPIPLSRAKQKSRGFNQSALLARELSSFLNIPCQENNLIKIKKTQSQTTLTRQERQNNIKSVFTLNNPAQVSNKTIFLVDDVLTTGATLESAAQVLKTSGHAHAVYALTIARQPLK